MRMHRLINILLSLEEYQTITAKQLAEKLEISVRTVYRDIDTLCEAGIPIVAQSGPNGGISLMEGYQTKIQHFDKEDIVYLYLNGLGVKAERSALLGQQSDNAMKKLLKILPEEDSQQVHGLTRRFLVDNSPWWGRKQPMPFIDEIVHAVWELQKLQINYEKVGGETSYRHVRPYGIVIKDHVWYLIAYCEKSNAIRIFRCDRIVECTVLNEAFVYPEQFVLEDFFEAQKKNFVQGCNLAEQYPVTIRGSQSILRWLDGLDYSINHLREQVDEYIISVNLYSLENAVSDYWNLLMHAEVLNPSELRNAIMEQLQVNLLKYQ